MEILVKGFNYLRSTPNTHVFLEEGVSNPRDGDIGSIYIKKKVMPKAAQKIEVTVTVKE